MKRVLFALALLASLTACGKGYSDGNRVGTVVKISHKGIFCKTWEVDIATNAFVTIHNAKGQPAGASNLFAVTVKDPAVLAQLQLAQSKGQQVEVTYEQWMIPPPCENDSPYDATAVEIVGN